LSVETIKDAKTYLASMIAGQAVRNGEPLSEVEEKMLYFSETATGLVIALAIAAAAWLSAVR
jgi:hypothetical protein